MNKTRLPAKLCERCDGVGVAEYRGGVWDICGDCDGEGRVPDLPTGMTVVKPETLNRRLQLRRAAMEHGLGGVIGDLHKLLSLDEVDVIHDNIRHLIYTYAEADRCRRN
jgi:DnaJ-class molecular chaperone